MQAEHVLVPTAEIKKVSKKPPVIKQGLMIRAPYTDFNIKKVFIASPVSGTSKNGEASFHECRFEYEYTMPDGITKRAPLQIEFPIEPSRRARSARGFTEVLKYIDPKKLEELKKDPDFKSEGTGRYAITCTLPGNVDTTYALCKIIQQIYVKCVHHMNYHGKNGTGVLGDKVYPIPAADERSPVGPLNTSDHLRYPAMHATTIIHNPQGREVKTIDLKGDVRVRMGVYLNSTEIMDMDLNMRSSEELMGLGFEHVPLMRIENLYIGAIPKVRFRLVSTVITADLPPTVMEQEKALEDLKVHRSNAAAQLADANAGFGLEGEGLDDPETGDYVDTEGEALPEPMQTPAITPISPMKRVQVASRLPSGSPRAASARLVNK